MIGVLLGWWRARGQARGLTIDSESQWFGLTRPPGELLDGVRASTVAAIASTTDETVEYRANSSPLPVLSHIDALPSFKRVLTAKDESVLKISREARREFVVIDLQAGMALAIATHAFRDTAQYASYLQSLDDAHIVVREEMVASIEVIASIYDAERVAQTPASRSAPREIGMFRDLIEAAHAYNASDVHFEVRDYEKNAEIRFRVNGDLYTYQRLPRQAVNRALSAAYQDLVQATTNSGGTFQPSAPQSGMIPLVVERDIVNLRWQSGNLNGGYDVGLRLLDGNFKNYSVMLPERMGFAPSQCEILYGTTRVSGGITFSSGGTGSGKSTLLRALSYSLPDRDLRKQFAVNEPSEYPQPWLSDWSIQRNSGESNESVERMYAEVIRTIMRLDPDDLTIGEIRDQVVAGLAVELALTGHPVRTTIHGTNLIEVVMRIVGGRIQIPIDEIASGSLINALINQEVVPTLCKECRVDARKVMPPAQIEVLERKFQLDTTRMYCRNVEGCIRCRKPGLFTRDGKVAAGTSGVTVVAEVYEPTEAFLERVTERDWRGAERVWRAERTSAFDDPDMTGKTRYEHALYKASIGLIDPQLIDTRMERLDRYEIQEIGDPIDLHGARHRAHGDRGRYQAGGSRV